MMGRRALPIVVAGLVSAVTAAEPLTLVVCAPGYPGTTEQAQTALDDFAEGVRRAAGWGSGRVGAVYHQDLDAGLAALEQPDAAVAMVPLPFYLSYRETLGLRALLAVAPESGAEESWSLVAARGTVTGPASLAGLEVTGIPGYAPHFVRRVALGAWAGIPEETEISFTSRVLSALRRAARGEPLAVVLDRVQTEALDSLPFADGLEVVLKSPKMPVSVVCSIGDRLAPADAETLKEALLGLHEIDGGRDALTGVRIDRFLPPPVERLRRLAAAHDGNDR